MTKNKLMSLQEAISTYVQDGDLIGIGGLSFWRKPIDKTIIICERLLETEDIRYLQGKAQLPMQTLMKNMVLMNKFHSVKINASSNGIVVKNISKLKLKRPRARLEIR